MRVAGRVLFSAALLWGGWLASAMAAEAVTARVESVTREADYNIGSIATQHVTVRLPLGFELDAGSLPAPAQNEAIELRNAHWQSEDVNGERVIRLTIDWQIFVAGDSVKIMPLKPLHLVFKQGQQQLIVDVPADKVIVSSLLPARIDDAHVSFTPMLPRLPGRWRRNYGHWQAGRACCCWRWHIWPGSPGGYSCHKSDACLFARRGG